MENLENAEVTEKGVVPVSQGNIISFDELNKNSSTDVKIFSNIKDKKKLFNLETQVDYLLNDCVGEIIRVKEILIKRYEKEMKEPIMNDETGEIIKEKEITYSTVLVDETGKSYATGSKVFTNQLLNMFRNYGDAELYNGQGLDMEIIKKSLPNSNNKALGFKLV